MYPTYTVNDGNKSTLEEAYRIVDSGIVAAVTTHPRIDNESGGGGTRWAAA